MTSKEKVDWLEQIFSNNPQVRRKAMEQELPQPLFNNNRELDRALEELARRKR